MRLDVLPLKSDNRSEQAECRSRCKNPAVVMKPDIKEMYRNATLLMNVFCFGKHSNFPKKMLFMLSYNGLIILIFK